MHTCPFCDEVCDCDCDDTWGLPVPDDCHHVCEESEEDWADSYDDDKWEDWADSYDDDGWEEYADYKASRQKVVHLWRFWASWDKGNFWRTIKIVYFPPSPNIDLPF